MPSTVAGSNSDEQPGPIFGSLTYPISLALRGHAGYRFVNARSGGWSTAFTPSGPAEAGTPTLGSAVDSALAWTTGSEARARPNLNAMDSCRRAPDREQVDDATPVVSGQAVERELGGVSHLREICFRPHSVGRVGLGDLAKNCHLLPSAANL